MSSRFASTTMSLIQSGIFSPFCTGSPMFSHMISRPELAELLGNGHDLPDLVFQFIRAWRYNIISHTIPMSCAP